MRNIFIVIILLCTTITSAQVTHTPSGSNNRVGTTGICLVNAAPEWIPTSTNKGCSTAYNPMANQFWLWDEFDDVWVLSNTYSKDSTTVSDSPTIDLTLSGTTISGAVVDGSITPAKLSQVYLTAEVDGSVTNEIQTISASAASANSATISQTLGGGSFTLSATSPLALTGAANAPTIGMGALASYDNPIAAGAGGVPIGGWFMASTTNTMGYVAGTPVIRQF